MGQSVSKDLPINSFQVLDSGARDQFNTGAQRDTQEGKGDFDLIPMRPLLRVAMHGFRPGAVITKADLTELMKDAVLLYGEPGARGAHQLEQGCLLAMWLMHMEARTIESINFETLGTSGGTGSLPYVALERVAELYRKGAVKYDSDNWRQGFPFRRMRSSYRRHALKYCWDVTEDHLAAVVFNGFCLMEFEDLIADGKLDKKLNNLYYQA